MFKIIFSELKKQGAVKVAVFGSYARHEEKKKSDIDVLVQFSPAKSLLDIVRIEREVSEKVGKKIDLLTESSISPLLIDTINKEKLVLSA